MSFSQDLLLNLAANLASDLIEAGAARLKTLALGDPEQRDLQACYQAAFQTMLGEVTTGLPQDEAYLLEDLLHQFIQQPGVAEVLLDMALTGAPAPDLPALRRAFDALEFDRTTLPVDFDRALIAFHQGLAAALRDKAGRPGSPLFNRVNLGRVIVIQALLQKQRHTLDEIVQQLQRLDAQGGAVYNIIIQEATGLAIGDDARVEQSAFPQEARDVLEEIGDAIRQLVPQPPTPAAMAEVRDAYLDWLIRQHSALELRGIRHAGQSPAVPLEGVYAALQAETIPASEWQESHHLLEEEFAAWLERQGLDDRDDIEKRTLRWRFLARHPLMPALEERDRPRLFAERQPETLHLAEAVRRYRWLVILGDPGSGKTTLLRWLTLQVARALRQGAVRVQVPAVHVDPKAEADAPPVDLGPARLPVLVRVAEYAEARRKATERGAPPPSLLEFLGHQGWQGEFPTFGRTYPRGGERIPPADLNRLIRQSLRRGQAFVLLDGLDEITAADERREMARAIESFVRDGIPEPGGLSPFDDPERPWRALHSSPPAERGGNQIVITSRIVGYHADPLSGRLTHATIQPMSDAAVDRFCQTWTLAVHRLLAAPGESEKEVTDRAQAEADSLQQAIHDPNRPGLRELAGNPLLLTILALVNHNSQARLPEQRVRLYQIAVENLVEVWRESGLSEDEVVQVLAPVAAHIHDHYPTGLIEERELREWVTRYLAEYRGEDPRRPSRAFRRDVDAFLRVVRERVGLLAARGEFAYGFLHLTFQEYLAGRWLAGDPETALEKILARRADPRWREPILLALGYLSWTQAMGARTRLLRRILEADDPLADLLPRHALLVAAALPEMAKAPPTILREVTRRLLGAYAPHSFSWLRKEIAAALARFRRGDQTHLVDEVLVEALTTPPPEEQPDPALAAAALIRQHEWFTRDLARGLIAALERDAPAEDWPITRALATLAAKKPEALPAERLPFRRALLDDPALAELVRHDPEWLRLILALYGGLDEGGNFHPRHIHRDSPLTPDLLAALRAGQPVADLRPALQERVGAPEEATAVEARMALALLGAASPVGAADISAQARRCIAARAAFLTTVVKGQAAAIAGALTALAPHLAGEARRRALQEALTAAQSIPDGDDRARALGALAPHLAGEARHRALQEALAVAQTLPVSGKFGSPRVQALGALAPHLEGHPDLLAEALAVAQTLPVSGEFGSPRVQALGALAPHLEGHPDLLAQALAAAQSIPESWRRADALGALAPHLEGYPDLLAQALAAAQTIPDADDRARARALRDLAPQLVGYPDLLAQALAAAQTIPDGDDRARALRDLSLHLEGETRRRALQEALAAAQTIPDGDDRARALGALAPHLEGEARRRALQEALAAAQTIPDGDDRAGALGALAPHLEGEARRRTLQAALAAAQSIPKSWRRADALGALAPHLEGEARRRTLQAALAAAQSIPDAFYRARALRDLAPHLAGHPDLLAQALAVAQSIPNSWRRAEALGALAPHLAGQVDLLAEALAAAQSNPDSFYRARALRDLAPQLAGQVDLLAQALAAAQVIPEADDRARALRDLAPHLEGYPDLLAQTLAAAQAIPESMYRARALRDLAPHLAGQVDLLAQALAAAQSIPNSWRRAEALGNLALQLEGEARHRALQAALAAVQALVASLQAFQALAPLAWPWSVPHDDLPALWAALEAAARTRQAEAMAWLMERLTEGGAKEGLPATPSALAALDELLVTGRPDLAAPLLPLLEAPGEPARATLTTWLSHPEPTVARHAALYLAEAGCLSPDLLPHLVALLQAGPDRSRYRAALALHGRGMGRQFSVTAIGRETVAALVELERRHHAEAPVGTLLGWALEEILHDDPAALDAWAQALAEGKDEVAESILGRVHHLTTEVWPVFYRWLSEGPVAVQEALLDSLAWLLRLKNLPSGALPQARQALHRLLHEADLRQATLEALGHLPKPQADDAQALLSLEVVPAAEARTWARALARLGARLPAGARPPLEAALHTALDEPRLRRAAAGGLVRLWLAAEKGDQEDFDPARLFDRLVEAGLSPPDILTALLTAGTDDDVWDDYHERVTRAARALVVARPEERFAPLLDHLEEVLTTTDADGWLPRRIALAVTAAVAEALPGRFRRRADPARLEGLLVQATQDAKSFSTRRFALTALSHLGRVTPAVAEALLAAIRDVGRVQQDALAATERFRLAEGAFLPALRAALGGESAATAYAAAQVLAALARRRDASERQALVEALAAALRDPRAHRPVYVLEKDELMGFSIKHLGRLDDLLFTLLVQVAGVASAASSAEAG